MYGEKKLKTMVLRTINTVCLSDFKVSLYYGPSKSWLEIGLTRPCLEVTSFEYSLFTGREQEKGIAKSPPQSSIQDFIFAPGQPCPPFIEEG